ncbi:helix-turn-helix domain-containing protein, partial [Streptomyces sp. KLMMK]
MAGTPGTPRVLRAMNDRAALELLVAHGPLTRTRLGELTGLSKPTAAQLLTRLEAAGLVRRTGSVTGRPGPSAGLYEVDPGIAHVAALSAGPEGVTAR